MREIKFRAWDPRSKSMRTVAELNFRSGSLREIEVIGFGPDRSEHLTVNTATLMQFTGLKDKNGVEIYEGDIVTGQGSSIEERRYQIIWHDEEASFWAKLLTEDRDSIQRFRVGQHFSTGVATEVIGNIYGNPELVK